MSFLFFAVLITNIEKWGEELIPENSTIFLCKCTDTSVTQDSAYSVPTPSASVTMVISDHFLSLPMVSSSMTGFDPSLFFLLYLLHSRLHFSMNNGK